MREAAEEEQGKLLERIDNLTDTVSRKDDKIEELRNKLDDNKSIVAIKDELKKAQDDLAKEKLKTRSEQNTKNKVKGQYVTAQAELLYLKGLTAKN